MNLGRLLKWGDKPAAPEEKPSEIEPGQLAGLFTPPRWLRDLGTMAWLLVGVGVLLLGVTVILGITSTIVDPVLVGGVVAAVASPIVSRLNAHGVPRAVGAVIVLLGFLAAAVVVLLLVLGGISGNSEEIKAAASHALSNIETWTHDVGADDTTAASSATASAPADIGKTLVQGVANGIQGLTSLAFFLSFMFLSLFFLLKDGPTLRRWIDGHVGLPLPVATTISRNVIHALRRYFLGVTIVAAFNGVVVGLAALLLGVPLAASIAVVTFVTAYVPYVGAVVAGAFAVIITLGTEGATKALIMLVVVILANGLLQNVFQPFAFGAALNLNPLAVLIVTISAGCLFGMVGLILAAPLTSAAVRISGDLARARAGPEPPAETASAPSS